jgi:hypothetical protein
MLTEASSTRGNAASTASERTVNTWHQQPIASSERQPHLDSVQTPTSRVLAQVGQLESSKSAMYRLAPEFRALMTILASVGPVISTRLSRRSAGSGATRHCPSRTCR